MAIRSGFTTWFGRWPVLRSSRTLLAMVAAAGFVAGPSESAAEEKGAVEVSRIGEASHFEFKGLGGWDYRLMREASGKVRLRLNGASQSLVDGLREHSDHLISRVEIKGDGDASLSDGLELVFHLRDPKTDFFDYTTAEPSRLILDFFPQAPTRSAANTSGVKDETAAAPGSEREDRPQTGRPRRQANRPDSGRTPAAEYITVEPQGPAVAPPVAPGFVGPLPQRRSQFGLFDGGDPDYRRFRVADYEVKEEATIASRNNIYVPFPILMVDPPHLQSLLEAQPIYEITRKESKENAEARLLLQMFEAKRYAVFLSTARDFMERYPRSEYDEMIRYMMADAHYAIWLESGKSQDHMSHFEQAMSLYRAATERYPDSPLLTRTLLLMGYSFVERGDSMNALKTFQRFNRLFPESKHREKVQLAIADAMVRLARYDDARRLLDELESGAADLATRSQAAFKKGDVDFRKGDLKKAIEEYRLASERWPTQRRSFPNAIYNAAEAHFELKQYREALNRYVDFVEQFPAHTHGGFALTRVGELIDILSGDTRRAMGAFLEAQFRFNRHPGASLARIRFLTSRFPQLKEKELESALSDVLKLSADVAQQPGFLDVPELTTLVIADGLTRRGSYDRANDLLVRTYQSNPQTQNGPKYVSRIAANVTRMMRDQVAGGNFWRALQLQSRNEERWLRTSGRIDTVFLTGRAYELAGVPDEAQRLYSQVESRLTPIRGTTEFRERSVFETLPGVDELRIRKAAVALARGETGLAQEQLALTRNSPRSSMSDALFAERADIGAELAERRGRPEEAAAYLRELLADWPKSDFESLPLRLRLARLLASPTQGEVKPADLNAASGEVDRVLAQREKLAEQQPKLLTRALEVAAQIAESRGRAPEAIGHLEELLKRSESEGPVPSIRYRLGLLQFNAGRPKDAEKTWQGLSDEKSAIWRQMADEKMRSESWRAEYQKYLSRIPAAAPLRQENRE